ncbi:type III secretion HpaP family protein [Schlegelella sp. S2-27]|uniref:Type III secretion HpaP family protein n=1 Tax=Caldimonas mangrovi TaxID=2944811 RepID=A0ABT0YRY2_9BURK|nr:type III secretion HpaP family protein [Caldimonas mangrovi]MCM5681489.1 type III secretion HpaP family protein [Caldimonas mangrovi]
MSDDEVRRPRRIIPAPPPLHGQPAAPAPPRQVERFQRVLQQGRRFDVSLGRAAQASTAPRGDTPVPADGRTAAQRGAGVAPGATAAPPGAIRPPRIVEAAAPAEMDSGMPAGAPPASPASAERPPTFGGETGDWDVELVRVIVTLCVSTDPAIEAWSVVVPLDERVLPQTELHLTLSRHALSLRFQTQATQSMRLLSRHRPSLAAMLHQALPGDREIDIDLT